MKKHLQNKKEVRAKEAGEISVSFSMPKRTADVLYWGYQNLEDIMDIKEQIHGLSEEMIENLGKLVAIDSQLAEAKEGKAIWRRTGRGASCGT